VHQHHPRRFSVLRKMNRILAKAAFGAGAIALASVAAFLVIEENEGESSLARKPDAIRNHPEPTKDGSGFDFVLTTDLPGDGNHGSRAVSDAVETPVAKSNEQQRRTTVTQEEMPAKGAEMRTEETVSTARFANRLRRSVASDAGGESVGKINAEQYRTTVPHSKPSTRSPAEAPIASSRAEPAKDQANKTSPESTAGASSHPKTEIAADAPQSGENLSIADGVLRSAPNLNPSTKKRVWPKPFTPEEERIRQQMGVQAFINLQHELATGQSREE
jgi:hypothetical protein